MTSRLNRPKRRLAISLLSVLVLLMLLTLVTYQYWWFPADSLPTPSRDLKSNLLPVMMYKAQIAAGELPFTSPWYGEPSNFSNPLWNFLYLPATSFSYRCRFPWLCR